MRAIFCSVILVACFAIGCGGASRKKVDGKIVKDGQPFTVSDKGVFVLSFVPENDTGVASYNATTKPDGTFTIVGPEGKGIPAGKYKVHLQAMDPYQPGGGTDKLAHKFAPGAPNPKIVEIGSGELVIDVAK